MATPAWQPRAGLPASASMAGPQGLWGPPGVPMNQGHAPPQLPLPGAPPLNFPPQMSGSLPPFGNPNQLSPASGSGLQPSRPALVPAPPMGAPYTVPQPGQSGLGYGIAQNPMPTKGWPSQAAGSAPVPASAGMPPHGKDSLLLGSRPGMGPATPSPSGAGSVLHEQRPPFQAFPPQHLLPPWMQLHPRPLFMSYQGEYEGVFPGQQQRHLVGSPSDSILTSGPHPSGSGEPQPFQATREPSISQGGLPLPAWAPYGAPPSVTLTTASDVGMTTSKSKPADSTPIVQVKTDIAPPGEQAVTGSGDKLKGAGETIPDLDAWTAHKTEDGAIYYYNSLSCQSTYTRPVEFKGEVA
jgi:transcription elongation regulator 1